MRHTPDLALVDAVAPLLTTHRFGRCLRGHERVDSTNTRAWAWAHEGAPEGSVVLAEYQDAGRGRLGRSWQAGAGLNLTFSAVLYPPLPPERLGLIALAAGLAVAEALEPYAAPVRPALKWPNDVLLEGKKCCGVLLESTLQARRSVVILGIGLNINQDAFPDALAGRATSLLLATGRHTPRAPLLADLLARLEARYDALLAGHDDVLRQAFRNRLAGLGETVRFRLTDAGGEVTGRLEGITENGALLLRTAAGLRAYAAGELTSAFTPPT